MAADVRNVLGIKQSGSNLAFLSEDEKRVIRESGSTSFKGHGLAVISESGLYELIMRSDRPQARVFQEWVTREVLPTIPSAGGACKTGGYVLQGADRATVGEGTVAEMPDVGGGLRVLYREGRLFLRGAALSRSNVANCHLSRFPNRGLIFLTRAGRNHVLVASTKPEAKEYREWLAGEAAVSPCRLDRESPTDS